MAFPSWTPLSDVSAITEKDFCNRTTLQHRIFLNFVTILLEEWSQEIWPYMSTIKTYFVTCCRWSPTPVQFVCILGPNSKREGQLSFTKGSLKLMSPAFRGDTCHLNSLSTRTRAKLQVNHAWQQLRWCALDRWRLRINCCHSLLRGSGNARRYTPSKVDTSVSRGK